jgi:methyl-accepting chemotaxis protein
MDIKQFIPDFIRKSFALKFAVAMAVLGVCIGSVGVGATTQIESQVKTGVNADQRGLAEEEAQKIKEWNNQNKKQVQLLTQSGQLKSGDSKRIEEYLSQAKLPAERQNLHYVDTDAGEIAVSTADSFQGQAVAEAPAPWRNAFSGTQIGVAVTDVYRSDTGDPLIAYISEVEGQAGKFLVYTVNLRTYSAKFATSGDSVKMVVDTDGQVVIGSGAPLLSEYTAEDSAVIKTATSPTASGAQTIKPESGALADHSAINGSKSLLVGYSAVPDTDWAVLVHTPTGQAYGFVESVSSYGYIATALGVLLVGIVGAVLGRNTATSIDRLTAKTKRMETGELDVDLQTTRIDSIGQLYDGFASMRDSLREQIQIAEKARQDAEEARDEAEQMTDHLMNKAEQYRTSMQRATDGDLTQRLDPESESQAMTDIAREFNSMIAELEETTESAKKFARNVATASEEVTASAEEIRTSSKRVTTSIQEISEGAEKQNSNLQVIQEELDSLSATTEEIAASASDVANLAEKTATVGKKGRKEAQTAMEGVREIQQEATNAAEAFEDLEAEVSQIDDLLDFITDVAEQTNMLALNANIEASRAGNDGEGDGFDVVASEVKELAEETMEAANDIEDRLKKIKTQTATASDEIQGASERIAEHSTSIERAIQALDNVAGYAQETNDGIQNINTASQQQATSTEEVVSMVNEVASISDETSAESETVAASAEEQTSAISEVSQSIEDLSQKATSLSEFLGRFDTAAEGHIAAPSDTDNQNTLDI